MTNNNNIVYNTGIMTNSTNKMYNKRKLFSQEIQRVLAQNTPDFAVKDFDSIKKKNYSNLGMDYWEWVDFLANLETTFSKDLAETTEKFKIETIDDVIEALYYAPDVKNLYNN